MKVDNVDFSRLFRKDVQYQVPIFQREYVWTLEDQWEALWGDIQYKAEEYLDHFGSRGDHAEAQRHVRPHFMGAVVLQQLPGAFVDISKCSIIDGQQRLITAQLVLAASSTAVKELSRRQTDKQDKNLDKQAKNLSRLLFNEFGEGDDRYKLQPALSDKRAFVSALNGQPDHNVLDMPGTLEAYAAEAYAATRPNDCDDWARHRAGTRKAYDYFRKQIQDWLEMDSVLSIEDKIHALATTLFGLLEIVVIDLDVEDDANIIFEVLNSRGTPLAPSDLIKNMLLHNAEADSLALYESAWKDFEQEWWRKEVQPGALVRSRFDTFLNYWMASVIAKEIRHDRVFPEFRSYLDHSLKNGGLSRREVAYKITHEIVRNAEVYRRWRSYAKDSESPYYSFFSRGWQCGLGAMTPLVLWLFDQPIDRLPKPHLQEILDSLESFLVRRALCRFTTAGLNRLCITILKRIRDLEGINIRDTFIEFLAEGHGTRRWPDDDDVRHSVLESPAYGRIGRPKLAVVLGAIEEHRRTEDSFAQPPHISDFKQLTVEHIMPQSWTHHWPLRSEDDRDLLAMQRNLAVDKLGNLTLLTKKLNAKISNGPWTEKRSEIKQHPGLYLNQDLLDQEEWTESAIEARGEKLLQEILQIWPRP